MKFQSGITRMVAAIFIFWGSFAQAGEQFKCFLETQPLDRTPIAIIHSNKTLKSMKWSLEVLKSANSPRTLLETPISDRTEESTGLYVNRDQGIAVKIFLASSDALGFMEGSIKSPAMNGNIRCLYAKETTILTAGKI